jgi:hypothetical protein
MLGGVSVPWNLSRPPIPGPLGGGDSDGDGIWDINEPGYEHDFDNDAGLPDDPTNEVTPNTGNDDYDRDDDNDGILDWPEGNDTMLVQPDNGKKKYIGPLPTPVLPVVTGEDVAYIFIDTDDNASTGYLVDRYIGAEYMLDISGKGNLITSKTLNRYSSFSGRHWKWEEISDVDCAVDSQALETQINFNALGIQDNGSFKIWFFTTDWQSGGDLSDVGITDTRSLRGTRAGQGGVLINEVYPDTNGWVELYNPTKKVQILTGWTIVWSGGTYSIPAGTTVNPGQYAVFNIGSIPASDNIILRNNKDQKKDETGYSNIPSGFGWGRDPAKIQNWYITYPTPGGPNVIPEYSNLIYPIMFIFACAMLLKSKRHEKLFKRRNSCENQS